MQEKDGDVFFQSPTTAESSSRPKKIIALSNVKYWQ